MSHAMLPEQDELTRSDDLGKSPIVPAPAPAAPRIPGPADLSATNEFDYKPIPMLAPVSLFLGLSSLIVFVSYFGLVIAAVGTVLSIICLSTIWKIRTEVGGFKMSVIGTLLSIGCLVSGSAMLSHAYKTEVPEGFRRISFNSDISKKGFGLGYDTRTLHPDVAALNGQKVFLKGFMYPTRQTEGLTEFVLAKDNGDCCFGGQPQITDMIYVRLKGNLKFDFTTERVSLAGIFHAGKMNQTDEGLTPIYELDAQYIETSRTAF